MELEMFWRRVVKGSEILFSLCPYDRPSEAQIKMVTMVVGLPVTFWDESFVIDPVRVAIFIMAYNYEMRNCKTIDKMVQAAWQWSEESKITEGD